MSNVGVLALSDKAIEFILSNYQLFSSSEVKIAAKRKVEIDRVNEMEIRRLEYEIEVNRRHAEIMFGIRRNLEGQFI